MTYEEVCAYFEGRGHFSAQKSNLHPSRCLEAMGNPDRRIGMVIHVAGTNGKGSVCAFLASVLKEAGVKTGLFTSPHLVRINERIAVDGEPISDRDFARIFENIKATVRKMEAGEENNLPYFKAMFLMAMQYFSEQGVRAAVIETGMGGRLDATNAMTAPSLTVITSIGLDHTQYLGNTIEEIAAEKAGILKPGVPCVYDASDVAAAAVIRAKADELGIPAYPLKTGDYRIEGFEQGKIDFSTSFRYDGRAAYTIHAAAPYQAANAALATLAFYVLRETESFPEGLAVSSLQLADGLLNMSWSARMEEIRPRVYLDGAHNPHGIARFLEAARMICKEAPCHLLFGVMKDKDYSVMIRMLARDFPWKSVTLTEVEGVRGLVSEEAAQLFRSEGVSPVYTQPRFETALQDVFERQGEGEYVMICGSLYLAGMCERVINHDASRD